MDEDRYSRKHLTLLAHQVSMSTEEKGYLGSYVLNWRIWVNFGSQNPNFLSAITTDESFFNQACIHQEARVP